MAFPAASPTSEVPLPLGEPLDSMTRDRILRGDFMDLFVLL